MNRRTRQLALAVSIALGTAGAGLQADITIDPGAGNGVVIPNINDQPDFDVYTCHSSGATGASRRTGQLRHASGRTDGPSGCDGARRADGTDGCEGRKGRYR